MKRTIAALMLTVAGAGAIGSVAYAATSGHHATPTKPATTTKSVSHCPHMGSGTTLNPSGSGNTGATGSI